MQRSSAAYGNTPSARMLTVIGSSVLQANSFPTCADAGEAHGTKVAFHRKAQLVAADLYLRFKGSNAALFAFEDAAELTADSGAYAIAQLRARGCIECSSECAKAIADEGELGAGPRERALRAAAVVAGGKLADAIGVEAWQLGRWLAQQVDGGHEGELVVHRTVQTVAY